MTPTALRSVVMHYLDGESSPSEFALALRALGRAPSIKVQARIETILDEIDRFLNIGVVVSRWPASLAVVRGLAGELLDTLPESNMPPKVDEIIEALKVIHGRIETQYGVDLIGLGGSSVSAKRTSFSDIDIAVKTTRKVSLMDMARATDAIRQALNWPVDLVFLDFAEPAFSDRFARNLIPIRAIAA
jgi:predicted nucleotidyltransferase